MVVAAAQGMSTLLQNLGQQSTQRPVDLQAQRNK
jgi:hypothetical protein